MNRNLDGCYFRVERDGKWHNVCFSDLTFPEREKVCEGRSAEWLKSIAYHLADCLVILGEQFDVVWEDEDEDT